MAKSCWLSSRRARLHVGQQRQLRAHHLDESAMSADLIAPFRERRRRTTDPYRANELIAVDEDRQRARVWKIAERYLACFRRAAGQHLVHGRLAGLAGVEHSSGLHERGLNVDLSLAIHAVEVDRLAELIENNDAYPHAPLDGL